jgi:hypothetical protein
VTELTSTIPYNRNNYIIIIIIIIIIAIRTSLQANVGKNKYTLMSRHKKAEQNNNYIRQGQLLSPSKNWKSLNI